MDFTIYGTLHWKSIRLSPTNREKNHISKANRILRIIGFHAHDLNMVPKITHYHQWGKGKNQALQFSKSGDKKLEEAYSRHYLWNQSPEKKQEIIERAKAEQTSGADGV